MKRAYVAPALLVVMASTVAAQQPPSDPPTVFRSGANLVPLNVTVTDSNKQFVKGLSAGDFSVFEDGVPQQVQFFEASQVPVDLIILLDTSSSMTDKMDVVHEAAIGFVKTLRPGKRGAIVRFADGLPGAQPLTSNRAALKRRDPADGSARGEPP